MARRQKKKWSKKKKVLIFGGLAVAIVVGIYSAIVTGNASKKQAVTADSYKTYQVKEGTVSTSTILTGIVKANAEQYVYFDSSKGASAQVLVSVGQQVDAGEQVVQYDKTTAQAAYDTAVRNLNKIGRQIDYLKTYGVAPATTQTTSNETSDEENATTVQQSQQQATQDKANYNQQLQDLNDSYADAQAEVNKAQVALNDTVVTSRVSGTVVEVNNDIDPSSKENKTLVHIATEGELQVQGNLSEYDLSTVKVGQAVTIKSKVYTDKTWQGQISYISNYPNDSSTTATTTATNSGASASNYEFKADITSPLDELKQGYTVSLEVQNNDKHTLVPISAIVKKNKKAYVWVYDKDKQKIAKAEVSLGQADAKSQEVLTGLQTGQTVIANPSSDFKNGQKLDDVVSE
ncbi:efflux RND transporter periplasmic adaptor subunit [Streptococcus sciuri]|uniref:Efflux RND transporter periplasmic adaptor subunit n=1 Tax=Streptococcus sciuri TaxID=2973939 RepID=A0ABT2F5P3_9STRE|nr:efflux RND transporter periplasmic adaptor subunit [Streptococcus sciuri]MCS4487793.1 efflux RND transporter periplasmic adaptor subunit [Streptococcus sciuri]